MNMVNPSLVGEEGKVGHEGLSTMPTVSRFVRESTVSYLLFPNLVAPIGHAGFSFLLTWPRDPKTTDYEWIYFGLDWGECDLPPAWAQRMALFDVALDDVTAQGTAGDGDGAFGGDVGVVVLW